MTKLPGMEEGKYLTSLLEEKVEIILKSTKMLARKLTHLLTREKVELVARLLAREEVDILTSLLAC